MRVVLFGGTSRPSTTFSAVMEMLHHELAVSHGHDVAVFRDEDLVFPLYGLGETLSLSAQHFLDSVREADGFVIASPGYHGTVSGLVKNAIDYFEELRTDDRPYLQGKPVGCVGVAHSSDTAVETVATLRQIGFALRGWPTPTSVAINSSGLKREHGRVVWDRCQIRQAQLMSEQLGHVVTARPVETHLYR